MSPRFWKAFFFAAVLYEVGSEKKQRTQGSSFEMKVAWAHVALFPRRDCQLTILIVLDYLSPLLQNFTLCKKISQTQSLTIVTHFIIYGFSLLVFFPLCPLEI